MPAPKDMTEKAALESLKAQVEARVRESLRKLMDELVKMHGTQSRAARVIGLEPPEVSLMQNGTRIPGADKIALIATRLNRSTDSILGLQSPELMNARALYEVLHRQFGQASETQTELERASETLRPPKFPTPEPHTEPRPPTNRKPRLR